MTVPKWVKSNKISKAIKKGLKSNSTTSENIIENSSQMKQGKINLVNQHKYHIDNFVDMPEPIEIGNDEYQVSLRDAVMISNCRNCSIIIHKKFNKLEINECNNVNVRFSSIIGALDIENSISCNVESTGFTPCINIDSSQSVRVTIPQENSDNVEISSSGAGSAEILIKSSDESAEQICHIIPFQYVHKIVNGELESKRSPLYGTRRINP